MIYNTQYMIQYDMIDLSTQKGMVKKNTIHYKLEKSVA